MWVIIKLKIWTKDANSWFINSGKIEKKKRKNFRFKRIAFTTITGFWKTWIIDSYIKPIKYNFKRRNRTKRHWFGRKRTRSLVLKRWILRFLRINSKSKPERWRLDKICFKKYSGLS